MSLAPRDYRTSHAAISGSISTFLEQHPDAIETLIYKADHSQPETLAGGDVVGAIEDNERTLAYADPEECKILMIPEMQGVSMLLEGAAPDGNMLDPVILLCSATDPPQQSVIQYQEFVSDTEIRKVNLYIVRSEGIGTGPGVGAKLYCLPMQAFEDLL